MSRIIWTYVLLWWHGLSPYCFYNINLTTAGFVTMFVIRYLQPYGYRVHKRYQLSLFLWTNQRILQFYQKIMHIFVPNSIVPYCVSHFVRFISQYKSDRIVLIIYKMIHKISNISASNQRVFGLIETDIQLANYRWAFTFQCMYFDRIIIFLVNTCDSHVR